MGKQYNHLTFTDRLKLENMLKLKISKKEIAKNLGVHISTIYRELKRGTYERKETVFGYCEKSYKYINTYSPDISEERYRENLKAKGSTLKISDDYEFANFIENKIVKDGLTPLAVLGYIKKNNIQFKTSICVNTLYSYIYKGVFLKLSMSDLPIKPTKKVKKNNKVAVNRCPRGESIEKRPIEVWKRKTFGHWEMDCVCGPKNDLNVLLVLTERLTRREIIIRMRNQTANSVVKALNGLEKKYGKMFTKLFKTITVDNGCEFSDSQGIEKSIYGNKKRTTVYYCHPYCSSERGTNERMNREIRRIYPKGTDFGKVKLSDIQACEDWLNSYPRAILDYDTPNNVFNRYYSNL